MALTTGPNDEEEEVRVCNSARGKLFSVHPVAQLVEALRRKITGSIPDDILGTFH